MIKNYLKIAFRVISRNQIFSVINILGLSIGIAAFVIIMLYVDYELSFENFQNDKDQVFRICPDKDYVGTPPTLGPLLATDFPEIEAFARISRSSWSGKVAVKADNYNYYENRFYFTDSTFFNTFDYPLLIGDKNSVLNEPFSIVVTESIARKYFNRIDVIGESIVLNNDKTFVISGIAKDLPKNTHFHFDLIAPFRGAKNYMLGDLSRHWGSYNYFTYLKLNKNVNPDAFKAKVFEHAQKEYGYINQDYLFEQFYLQPITKAHLEIIRGNLEPPVDIKYVYIYLIVGIIILVIACINFINLSIASSVKRSREVGLRKVIGAGSNGIRFQFLSESVIYTLISVIISIGLIEIFVPILNEWNEVAINVNYLSFSFIGLMLLIIFIVGIVSGSYPSFIVSRLQPIKVLRSGIRGDKSNKFLRSSLIVTQFTISIGLIIASMVIYQQMKYIQNINIGFNKEQLISIPLYEDNQKNDYQVLTQLFKNDANIVSVCADSYLPAKNPWHQTVWVDGKEGIEQDMTWYLIAGKDFFKTFEINLLYGSTFPSNSPTEVLKSYVINKSAAIEFFGDENAVGKKISMRGEKNMGSVVGVIDDFNFRSLHHAIEPLVFSLDKNGYDYISLRIRSGAQNNVMNTLEEKWKSVYPNHPFETIYINDNYDQLYKTESRTGKLITFFTLLSVFISSMGLFGINAYTTRLRTREISIRKVFGASVNKILLLLSTDFAKWVLIANIISWPIAYYFMDKWLQNFTFRVHIEWWMFVSAGLFALIFALITTSWQSIKTANTNPSETLKFE